MGHAGFEAQRFAGHAADAFQDFVAGVGDSGGVNAEGREDGGDFFDVLWGITEPCFSAGFGSEGEGEEEGRRRRRLKPTLQAEARATFHLGVYS